MSVGLFLGVAIAGAAGAVARAAISALVRRRWPRRGLGTLAVNLSGAFALGVLMARPGIDVAWLQLVGTGFLGAFTTFSTWMAEAAATWREGRRLAAAAEVAATLGLGVAAAALGAALAGA